MRALKSQVNPQSYVTWFEPTRLAAVSEGELLVEGPNQFFVDWLAEHHLVKLILIGQAMARPFAAPPGIPADRRAALIAAFERTNADPDFLAEAQRLDLDVNPVSAGKLDALLAEAYATPKDVIAKAAKAMSD